MRNDIRILMMMTIYKRYISVYYIYIYIPTIAPPMADQMRNNSWPPNHHTPYYAFRQIRAPLKQTPSVMPDCLSVCLPIQF